MAHSAEELQPGESPSRHPRPALATATQQPPCAWIFQQLQAVGAYARIWCDMPPNQAPWLPVSLQLARLASPMEVVVLLCCRKMMMLKCVMLLLCTLQPKRLGCARPRPPAAAHLQVASGRARATLAVGSLGIALPRSCAGKFQYWLAMLLQYQQDRLARMLRARHSCECFGLFEPRCGIGFSSS